MTPELHLLFIGIAAVFIVLIGLVLAAVFKRDDAVEQAHKDADAIRPHTLDEYYTRRRASAVKQDESCKRL